MSELNFIARESPARPVEELVTIVDHSGRRIGPQSKIRAHLEGTLHLAFSIFVFNDKSELLLQQRSSEKYHSGHLWTNTCCGHPRPEESVKQAAIRRLNEEMGFVCELIKAGHFTYKAQVSRELIEHELDHVFIGKYDGDVFPNRAEAVDYKWLKMDALEDDIANNREKYTAWFQLALREVLSFLDSRSWDRGRPSN